MTEEEIKALPTDTKIRMTCLEGQPTATLITHGKIGIVVQLDNEGGIFLLNPDHLVKGAEEIQAIDFAEEVKMPHDGDIPDFVKRAIMRLSGGDVSVSNVKHDRIGENVSAFRVDVKPGEGHEKFTKNIGLELVRRIHAADDCDGIQAAMMVNKEGHLGYAFLSVEPYMVYGSIRTMMHTNEFDEVAFTIVEDNEKLDKSIQVPGFKYFQKIYMKWRGNWWYAVLPFNEGSDGKPVFGEIDWANDTWSERMELDLVVSDFFEKKLNFGKAMHGKINVTKYVENGEGWFYEGTVNQDKLSGKLRTFLDSNKLDVNDRAAVNNKLRDLGRVIKMEKDKSGFITVRAGNYFASDRRSKTRAYIEALENVVSSL